jgi:hypothetical protein
MSFPSPPFPPSAHQASILSSPIIRPPRRADLPPPKCCSLLTPRCPCLLSHATLPPLTPSCSLTAPSSFLSSPARATGASSFSVFACATVGAEALTVVFLTCNASQQVPRKVLDAESNSAPSIGDGDSIKLSLTMVGFEPIRPNSVARMPMKVSAAAARPAATSGICLTA